MPRAQREGAPGHNAPGGGAQSERQTMDAILAAARRLFHSPGYSVTRVADIAHCAGVSRATVYNHFADKKSILYRLVRDYMAGYEQIGERLKAQVDPAESVYQLLRNLVREAMLWRIENADLRPAIDIAKQLPTSGWKEANEAADQAMHGWIADIHHASAKLDITRSDIDIDFASGALYSMIETTLSALSPSASVAEVDAIAEQLTLLQWHAIYTIPPDQAPVAGDVLKATGRTG
jgi:AcrR family transcriptional regulator